eukprot:4187799-Pyramimonas_sp.AAC.1
MRVADPWACQYTGARWHLAARPHAALAARASLPASWPASWGATGACERAPARPLPFLTTLPPGAHAGLISKSSGCRPTTAQFCRGRP